MFCSAQRLNDLGDESRLLPLWRQAEPRFLWNNYMLEVLIDNKVGTRMWRRGVDPDGYVANFVEIEQIMQFNGYTASFVQVRGSIPLLWQQIVDLTYKPKFELLKLEEAPRVLERHFLDLRKKYGAVLAVDVVNEHGGEGRLCEKFGDASQHVAGNDISALGFHHVCGHVHFDRLSILYDQIQDILERNGYLLLNGKGEKMKEQVRVVRTNCIDCLDRTNVTQSMIGRNMLEYQLRRLGVFGAEETISSHPNLDENFKIYLGTAQFKGYYKMVSMLFYDIISIILLMERSSNYALGDTEFSCTYFTVDHNLKIDAIDLLQGHYIVSVGRDTAATSQKGCLEASFPLALGLVLIGFLFAAMSLRQVQYDFRHIFFSLMWAGISIGIAAFVRANGRVFCNRPRLHNPR
ncbi:Phosphoinositide phosphatase SAC7 [Glycine soja]